MIEFRVAQHAVTGHEPVCEIWIDGEFKGALYSNPPNTVRLITGHLDLTEEGLTPHSAQAITVTHMPMDIDIIDVMPMDIDIIDVRFK